MKIYVLVKCGYDVHHILGVYDSREEALKDADFIAGKEQALNEELWGTDSTFRQRIIKHGDVWYEQSLHRSEDQEWPEWGNPVESHGDSILIEEHTIPSMPLQDQWDAIEEWQNTGTVHPLTCGKNSNHPNLVPYFDFNFTGIGLRCIAEECEWVQRPNHSILSIVYATYIRNRAQAGQTWRLRELRQAQGDSSPHA